MGPPGIFNAMDDESAELILQLTIEDGQQFQSGQKSKGRECDFSDMELAVQLSQEFNESLYSFLQDRKMTRSVAQAVTNDGAILAALHAAEQQADQDRRLATQLSNGVESMSGGSSDSTMSEDLDEETIKELGARYISNGPEFYTGSRVQPPSEHEKMPESSGWAATRPPKAVLDLSRCVACTDDKLAYDVTRAPCRHEYCRDCLSQLFESAMMDESLFPPRCCKEQIPLDPRMKIFLSPALVDRFVKKMPELESKNRTYCFATSCSVFIPADRIDGDIATCPQCNRTTCITCKAAAHSGDCPKDTALQQLITTAQDPNWQRCYQCRRMVELETECNHMRLVLPSSPCALTLAAHAGLSFVTSVAPNGRAATVLNGTSSGCMIEQLTLSSAMRNATLVEECGSQRMQISIQRKCPPQSLRSPRPPTTTSSLIPIQTMTISSRHGRKRGQKS